MTYAKNLTGRLMLDYGTIDNNVHNTNMMQMIKALQGAGKELRGAGAARRRVIQDSTTPRMMEFFIENLIQHPERIHEGYEQAAVTP